MPALRRWGKLKLERHPQSSFKVLAAILVITLYLIIKEFQYPSLRLREALALYPQIQHTQWDKAEITQEERADGVREAMKHTFWKYRENAWGADDILPVTGGNSTSRNGWGAFIVDAASTLALMELWDELGHAVEHILAIDFDKSKGLVDPFETTIRYLGGMLSLVDLHDAGLIPQHVMHDEHRDLILEQVMLLAEKLSPAYDTPTGMPWTRVDFERNLGTGDGGFVSHDPALRGREHPRIGPARAGSSILENRVLTRLTGNDIYTLNSTLSWAPYVWSKWITPWAGMVDAPVDIMTGAPTGRIRHWDAAHDSYYEYLLKITLLAPPSDPHLDTYKSRFLDAAFSLRNHLSSRSAPASEHLEQHLYIGRQDDEKYENKMSHLACFAPGTLLLGSQYYDQPALRTFALALLEGCRHVYASTPTGIGPESWAWVPKLSYEERLIIPSGETQKKQAAESGFWAIAPQYHNRPEYVESLFYAWRITGESFYRDWAWEAFTGMETYSKAPYGYAQLRNVYDTTDKRWLNMQESFWAAETLKYLYLTFADVRVASLDYWVFSTEGHVFRMIR